MCTAESFAFIYLNLNNWIEKHTFLYALITTICMYSLLHYTCKFTECTLQLIFTCDRCDADHHIQLQSQFWPGSMPAASEHVRKREKPILQTRYCSNAGDEDYII